MENNKRVIIIILAIFVGFNLWSRVVKYLSPQTSPIYSVYTHIEDPTDIDVNDILNKKSKKKIKIISKTKAPALGALRKVGKKVKSTKKVVKGTQKKNDKKQAKKNKKKKKKQAKKKKDSKKSKIQKVAEDQKRDSGFSNTPQAPLVYGPAYTQKEEEEETDSVEQWAEAIMNPPNFKNLTDFIHRFQVSLLDQAIFYSVVDLLIDSDSEVLNEYGIIALGSTPSPQSFTQLAVIRKERAGTELAKRIDSYIKNYRAYSYVSVLSVALNSSIPEVRIEALTQIAESAKKNIGQAGENPQPSLDVRMEKYTPFLDILRRIASEDTDPGVVDKANHSLQVLESILT
jgi:hypothetical protein